MSTKDLGTVREYYSSNKDNRFLIRVHFWGDIGLSGIHYIPDDSTALDALSFAGGPVGQLGDTLLTIHRLAKGKDAKVSDSQEINIPGNALVSDPIYSNFHLQSGDVLYLESPPKADNFMRNLALVSSVLGVITAGATVYLLATK